MPDITFLTCPLFPLLLWTMYCHAIQQDATLTTKRLHRTSWQSEGHATGSDRWRWLGYWCWGGMSARLRVLLRPMEGAGCALCSRATRRLRKQLILERARLLCCARTSDQCCTWCLFSPCTARHACFSMSTHRHEPCLSNHAPDHLHMQGRITSDNALVARFIQGHVSIVIVSSSNKPPQRLARPHAR